jgi:ribosomal protein L7/L12
MPDSRGNQRRWWPRPLRLPNALQREADRRAGELLTSLLDQAGKAEIETLIARGKHALAMRRVRELTGLRLLDAKRVVDSLRC